MIRKRNQAKQQKQNKPVHVPTELTFLEHIYELRKRLFWVVLTIVVTSAISLQFKDVLIEIVMAPLKGGKLIYLTPGGGFSFIFTLCLYTGVLFTIPVAVYQIYKFLKPILKSTSRRFVMSFMVISTILAVIGSSFGYYFAIPAAINFLNNFAGDSVVASLTAESYLGFVVSYMLGLALLFQLPLLLFLFDHIKPFPPGTLSNSQRYVIVAATILAALITPTPDMFNMAIVAGPIIIVYEFGALAVYARRRSRNRALKAAAKQVANPVIEQLTVIEEPLTAMIEEFNSDDMNHVQQSGSVSQQSTEFIASTVKAASSVAQQPAAAVISKIPAQSLRVNRSMDGFMVTNQHVTNIRIPTREEQRARLLEQQRRNYSSNGGRNRSMDGFITA